MSINLFLKISNYNNYTSDIVDITKYSELKTNNGGHWCRRDGPFGKYKFYTVKKNGKILYSFSPTKEEQLCIEKEVYEYRLKNKIENLRGNCIMLIKIVGVQDKCLNRPIRQDIRDIITQQRCVSCGTNNDIEVDHKNGLYNDARVLDKKTQLIEDFQSLCRHCNLEKREVVKKMKETGKRPSACQHPLFSLFKVDFLQGNEGFDPKDPNALVGTLWYDFLHFQKTVYNNYRFSISFSS